MGSGAGGGARAGSGGGEPPWRRRRRAGRESRIGQPAPDISGGPWINSEPLTMEKLRGRVVYVEFWTYG